MEECGVFGTFLKKDDIAPAYVVEGLMALQHRGQEAAGVSYTKGEKIESFKELGTVGSIFNKKTLSNMKGKISIGHVRYSTKGTQDITGAQPFTANYANSSFSIAHNGQIENSEKLKNDLEKKGIIFLTDSDTEIVLHLLVSKLRKSPDKWTLEEISKIVFENIGPSYSLLIMFKRQKRLQTSFFL
jgi:amidophosphoribosyltransferase